MVALAASRALPEGPADLPAEVRSCLLATVALALWDEELLERAHERMLPAEGEFAGAAAAWSPSVP